MTSTVRPPAIIPSPWQNRVLVIPEAFDLFLGGGRGGAKSFLLGLLALRHMEQFGNFARCLFVRQTYAGLRDFEAITDEVLGGAYGRRATYNRTEHLWRLPAGGTLELNQLGDAGDYRKIQGRSFTFIMCDEAGQYAEPDLLDRLRSNIRSRTHVPCRCALAANPGDVGHVWLAERYALKTPWLPFIEPKSKRQFVNCHGTFKDNPFIDHAAYEAQLEASCPNDPELLAAWKRGDWAVIRGAFFAGVLSDSRNAVDPWPTDFRREGWSLYLAHDYGVSAPSVTIVLAKSDGAWGPDDRFYPRGSIVALDEFASNVPGSYSQGMGYTVPVLAAHVKALATKWRISPTGPADDAIFSRTGSASGTIANEFSREGVHWRRANKGSRVAGWERMRTLLSDAGKPDRPGLYMARNCSYLWGTLPVLGRDPKQANDVDTRQPDHGADALRYGLSGDCGFAFKTF
jgi:hypothetical protein